jgi:DNA polymerase III subunit epsilon
MNKEGITASSITTCALDTDPDVKILRRVSSLNDFPLPDVAGTTTRTVALVDTETTGTDPLTDEIIDIAVVVIGVNDDGEITEIISSGQGLRDPGKPIPEVITRLTGITDADVHGVALDTGFVEKRLLSADVRLAHQAKFDIAYLEKLMPALRGAAWACSSTDFDWAAAAFDGRKLGHLLMQMGHFNEAHRAMADVISLLYLVTHQLPDGSTVLGQILKNAERRTYRIEAVGAPFDKRSLLKSRGYSWDPRIKVWWIVLSEDAHDDEVEWLRQNVTPFGPEHRTRFVTWHDRHR